VVVAHQKKLIVWNAGALDKPVLIPADTRHHFTAAAYHPSGRYLFTTSNDATVTVWDADSWVRVKRFDWDVGRLRSVAVSPDGLLAAAGSDRGRVVVWDVDV
jgi:WD40 repeat protein